MESSKSEKTALSLGEKTSLLQPSKDNIRLQQNAKDRRESFQRRACLGVACIALAAFMIFSGYGSSPLGTMLGEKCSGNGVYTENHCLCDVGFGGRSCNLVEKYVESVGDRSKSALLVVSSFGQLRTQNDELSQANPSLAAELANDGYDVTVLYTGNTGSRSFGEIQLEWKDKGVKLVELPSFGMSLGNGHSPTTETSYRVYQYIRSQPSFGLVQFNAANGVGFFTLQAQRQGVLCFNSKFIATVDEVPKKSFDKVAAENPDFISTDVEALKTYHLEKKSAELADLVVASSASLLKAADDQGWSFSSQKSIVTPYTDDFKVGNTVANKFTDVKEIVFVGSLDIPSGLNQFLATIDVNSERIREADLIVTFLGRPSTVNELASEDYIMSRAHTWDFAWSINDEIESVDEIVAYLKTHQAIAVLPSLVNGSPYLVSRIVRAQVPLLTTSESAREILNEEDARIAIVTKEYLRPALETVIAKKSALVSRMNMSRVRSRFAIYAGLESEPVSCAVPPSRKPSVSVVLVTHNRPDLLLQAIASLESQTHEDFEVVLVDDGSTDPETIKLLNDLAWRWWEERAWKILREPNRYLGAARNTGAKHAKGKYVLFMDDDDVAKPNQIEVMLRVATTTGANVVTTGHDTFTSMSAPNSRSALGRFVPLGDDTLSGMLENVFGDASMLVEMSAFREIGGFTEEVGVGFEDYEFLASAALKGYHLEAIPEALHWYRRHAQSMSDSTNLKSNQLRFLRAYAEAEGASKEQIDLLRATRHKFFERGSEIAFSSSNDTIPIDTDVPEPPPTNVTYPDPTEIDPNGNYTEVIDPHPDAPSDTCPDPSMTYSCGQCIFAEDCPGICPDGPESADWSRIRDCNGQCVAPADLNVVEDCRGQCVDKNSITYTTDCHGSCIPTSTSPMPALDLCNVCDGDGNSCKDCKGVRFGSAQLDACNVCDGDSSTCLALNSISPLVSLNDGTITFVITGGGLKGATLVIDGNNIAIPNGYQQSTATVTVAKMFTGLTNGVKSIPVQLTKYGYNTTPVKYVGVYSASVQISAVSPEKLFYSEPTTLTISGTNLFDPSTFGASPVCVFGDDGQWITPATYVSGGNYTCSAPNLDLYDDDSVTDMSVRFKFDRHSPDFAGVNGQVAIHYWARAPKTQNAYFSDDGESIVIEFDSAATANNLEDPTVDMWDAVPCSKYLFTNIKQDKLISGQEYLSQLDTNEWNVAELARTGEEGDCTANFITPTKLMITLSYDFVSSAQAPYVPVPGRRLVLRPGIFVAFGAGHSESQIHLYPDLIRTVVGPTTPPVPKIVARSPTTIGTCSNLEIDLSETAGSLGRPFSAALIQFTSTAPETVADAALTAYLNNLAADLVQNNNLDLIVPKALLSARKYTFKIVLKNFLNGVGIKTFSVTKLPSDDYPPLDLQTPPNRAASPVNGEVSVRPDDEVAITALFLNPCNLDRELKYEWSSTGPTNITIPQDQIHSDSLYFAGYTLVPGKVYKFTVKAYFAYFESSSVTLDIQVYVQPGDINVDIGGDRSVSASNALTLTAGILDNSYPQLQQPTDVYDIRWTCIGPNKSRCVDLTTGRTLIIPFGRKVTLAANTLPPNTYSFFGQVYNNQMKSSGISKAVSLTLFDKKLPSVSVSVTEMNPSAFSTKFALQAVIDPSTIVSKPSKLVYKWESVIKIPNAPDYYTTIALNNGTLNVKPGTPFLSFKPGQLLHGSSYAMKLTVTDPSLGDGSLPGVAYAIFNTRKRPSNGVCSSVGPVTGEELNFANKFGWKCSGWTTDAASMPLRYTVESKLSTSNNWVLLSSGDTTPSWSNPMPRGNFNIRVTIVDSVGARNANPFVFSIQVNPAADSTAAQKGYLNAGLAMKNAKAQLVVLGISSTFGSVQQSMQLRRRSTDEEDIQTQQLALMASILDGGIGVDVQNVGPMLSSILLSIAGQTGVPPSLVDTAFGLYQAIISKISDGAAKINTCVAEAVTIQLVQTADSLMTTVKQNSMADTAVSKYLQSTMSQLEGCITRTLTCGAAPLTASGNAITREIGIIDPSSSTSFCGFTTDDLSSAIDVNSLNSIGCMTYSCGSVDPQTVLTVTDAVGEKQIGSQLVNLEFRTTDSQDVIVTDYSQGANTAGEFEFVVQSTQEYFDRFNLASYDVSFGAYNDPTTNPYGPMCAYYVFAGTNGSYIDGSWSSTGVRVVSVDAVAYTVTCASSHLTTFGLLSTKNLNSAPVTTTSGGPEPTSTSTETPDEVAPTGTSGGLPTAAIAGIGAGVGCAALIAAGVAYYRYRSRHRAGLISPAPALTMTAAGQEAMAPKNPTWAEPRTAPAYTNPPTFDEHNAARAQH